MRRTQHADKEALARPGPRPGGRSARVQAAVHAAVRDLQEAAGRHALTVPTIAAKAGVTPSTIYRRWGDLAQLLADVAVEQLRPDEAPEDNGSFEGDLAAWLEQYADEMSSAPGRTMLRDVLSTLDTETAGRCLIFCTQQIDLMRERALARGERPVASAVIVDHVVAPIMYRILFGGQVPSSAEIARWLALALSKHPRPASKV